jgi:hypothetical protein
MMGVICKDWVLMSFIRYLFADGFLAAGFTSLLVFWFIHPISSTAARHCLECLERDM